LTYQQFGDRDVTLLRRLLAGSPSKDVPGHHEDRRPVTEPVERDHRPIR